MTLENTFFLSVVFPKTFAIYNNKTEKYDLIIHVITLKVIQIAVINTI